MCNRRPFPALLVAALAALACAAPPRPSPVRAEAPPSAEEEAATSELQALRAAAPGLAPAAAAQRFEALAAREKDSPQGDAALYEAGMAWRAAGRLDRAQAAFTTLLARHPMAVEAPEAKLGLARTELEAGRPREALGALSPALLESLPPGRRLEAARVGARAAEGAQAWPEAARWQAQAARLAPEAERGREVAGTLALVDAHLAPAEVVALAGALPAESPLRPALRLRAARAHLQLGDPATAEAEAREVAQGAPGTPEAAEARAFAEQLSHRAPLNPRVIGVAVPLSGKQKQWGEAILQAVTLALGEKGPYRLAVVDTRGEADGARAALEKLSLVEGAAAALGGVTLAEAQEAARTAQQQGLPFVSLSRAEGVTSAGPFVFRTMLTAEAQARALAELAVARRGMRRFALLWPQVPYGTELAHAFWDEVEARGGEVRAAESYAADRTTFGPLVKGMVGKLWLDERQDYAEGLAAIAAQELDPYRRRKAVERLRAQLPPEADFDAVFIPDFAKNVALVAPALAVEDVVTATCDAKEVERVRKTTGRADLAPVQLLGANGWDDPALVERAGRYVECALFVDGFYAASERPATKAFVEAFRIRYERPPTILEATAFDSALLLRRSVEGGAATRDAVRAALAAVKGLPGATGDLGFDARREVEKQLFFLTVERGAVRELTPAELGQKNPG